MEGCRWHIRNGKFINLWIDYWLPGYTSLQYFNSTLEMPSDSKVELLFDQQNRAWNVGKVGEIFPPHIVAEVLKQIIPTESRADNFFWENERSGTYGVFSAYRMCKQNEKD